MRHRARLPRRPVRHQGREGRTWEYAPDKWQLSYVPVPTDQCDLCASRTAAGKQPSCVHNCQADCMRYGTLEELAEYMGDNSHQALFFPR